jgi:protein O-GlcNAc transferase
MLMNLKLPQLIAENAAQYVNTATQLARDLPRLAALRASLRPRFAASPLMDYSGFAHNLEAAYRDMWRSWIASN